MKKYLEKIQKFNNRIEDAKPQDPNEVNHKLSNHLNYSDREMCKMPEKITEEQRQLRIKDMESKRVFSPWNGLLRYGYAKEE